MTLCTRRRRIDRYMRIIAFTLDITLAALCLWWFNG